MVNSDFWHRILYICTYSGLYENPVLSEPENISRRSLLFLVEMQKIIIPEPQRGYILTLARDIAKNCKKCLRRRTILIGFCCSTLFLEDTQIICRQNVDQTCLVT